MIIMLPEDGDILTERLRAKFPTIRFLPLGYSSVQESRHNSRPKRYDELGIDYLPGCHDERHFAVKAWVEPEGWTPFWIGPNEEGYYRIINEPESRVVIQGIGKPVSDELGYDMIWEWTSESAERKRFFGQVKRVVTSFCTDWLWCFDPKTGLERNGLKNYNFWMGPHAVEWCNQHPLRHCDRLRPPPPGSPPDPRRTGGRPVSP